MSGQDPLREDLLRQDLLREAERVADRLRVVGPRMAARGTPEADAVLADVRAVLQRLADLGAQAEGCAGRTVPVLAAHALGDQVLVLVHDVVDVESCSGAGATLEAALEDLMALKRRL